MFCKGKDAFAQGKYTEDGVVVFAGSTSNLEESNSIQNWISTMRAKLQEQGILIQDVNLLKFTSNYIFSSPSGAAGVVLGRNANGWIEWKFQDGKTLDEVKRQTEWKTFLASTKQVQFFGRIKSWQYIILQVVRNDDIISLLYINRQYWRSWVYQNWWQMMLFLSK